MTDDADDLRARLACSDALVSEWMLRVREVEQQHLELCEAVIAAGKCLGLDVGRRPGEILEGIVDAANRFIGAAACVEHEAGHVGLDGKMTAEYFVGWAAERLRREML